jgi:hypothetical protein
MKQLFFIISFFIGCNIFGQINPIDLHNNSSKNWRISQIVVNDEEVVDTDSTCYYYTIVTFNVNGNSTMYVPCIEETSNNSYTLIGNSIIADGLTASITALNANNLVITASSTADVDGQQRIVVITTTYVPN